MPDQLFADIVILGGGPAGMTAAISAARISKNRHKIILLESGARVGKKLLSTGNGRCNLTNTNVTSDRYHGKDSAFIQRVLNRCSSDFTVSFFSQLGLLCREEEGGRVYPCSGQASSVLDVLRQALEEQKIQTICNCTPHQILSSKKGFTILCDEHQIHARKVILATGGKAAPSTGSNGSGYELVKALGHSITPLFPALAPIRTDPQRTRPMKGMRNSGCVTLWNDNRPFKTETGEIQFTDGALSGVCVFQLSRYAMEYLHFHTLGGYPCQKAELSLDLLPEYTAEQIAAILTECSRQHPSLPLELYLGGMMNKRVGQTLLKSLNLGPLSTCCGKMTKQMIQRIASTIKDWRFPILASTSWNQAQVTAGGIPLREFDSDTLESRKAPGLYAAGEILDADGDCGGFNLQWAWSTGKIAGESAANQLIRERRNPS